MRVKNGRTSMRFYNLPIGEVFATMESVDLWMKIENAETKVKACNAVCLTDGILERFTDDEIIYPITGAFVME